MCKYEILFKYIVFVKNCCIYLLVKISSPKKIPVAAVKKIYIHRNISLQFSSNCEATASEFKE